MSNLASRALSGAVALPLLTLLILWERRIGFGVLILVCSLIGMREFMAMLLPTLPKVAQSVVMVAGVGLTAGLYFRPDLALLWLLAALVLGSSTVLLAPGEIAGAGARLGLVVLGLLYVGALTAPLGLLHRLLPDGPFWVLTAIGATFANDTGAYFAGRAFGRHKLYPTISPGKTVEGGMGGLAASVGALFLFRASFFPSLTLSDCLLVSVPAAILGPTGDLVESMLKRAAGVKDSGHLIPGHGGLLDRLDALLFVSAWVFAYASYLR